MSVIVVRVLTFTFPTQERADEHISLWSVPANGTSTFGDMTVESEIVEDSERKRHLAKRKLQEALENCDRLGLVVRHTSNADSEMDDITVNWRKP